MSDENRVMKLLRQIQADQAEIRRDTREIKGRFIQMDGAPRSIHAEMTHLYGLYYAHQNGRIDRIEICLEHRSLAAGEESVLQQLREVRNTSDPASYPS